MTENEPLELKIGRENESDNSRWMLIVTDFARTASLFEKFREDGWDQGGYGWYGVVNALIHLKAPELADTFDFDPQETRLVIRSEEKAALERLAALIREAVHEPSFLKAAIAAQSVLGKHGFKCPMHGAPVILADGFECHADITFESEWMEAQSLFPYSVGLFFRLKKSGWFGIPVKIIYCPECQAGFEKRCEEFSRGSIGSR